MQQSSLVSLIILWEKYSREEKSTNRDVDLMEFAEWMLHQPEAAKSGPAQAEPPNHDTWEDEQYEQVRLVDKLSILVWRLSRFMRVYFKQHFEGHPLQSIDEFLLLAGTHFLQQPTKTELFRYDLMETTTGIQMLARLTKQGLAEETVDPEDRRQKRVALTDKGQAVYEQAAVQMDLVGDELFPTLSDDELRQLEGLLFRLNAHHTKRLQTG